MNYSFGDLLISMFWFLLLVAWIWLLIAIVADIFRDTGLSGWGKAGWTFFLIAIPWLGALVYLIARRRSMNERALRRAAAEQDRMGQLARGALPRAPQTTSSSSPTCISAGTSTMRTTAMRNRSSWHRLP